MYDALLIQLEKNRVGTDSTDAHIFDFGPKELINMVGIPQKEASFVLRKMLENKNIKILKDKIFTEDVSEITKQTEYFRKMHKIAKSRQDAAAHS
jgi:phage FluMu gp28-like protein